MVVGRQGWAALLVFYVHKYTTQVKSAEKTYAGQTTKRRVALLDDIGFFT